MFISSLRRGNGFSLSANMAIVLTLALSLTVGFGGVGFVLAVLTVHILATRLEVISRSLGNFNRDFLLSDEGIVSVTIIAYVLAIILIAAYHVDNTREIETSLKLFLIGYFVVNCVEDYSLRAIFIGSAMGAVLACGYALYEVGFLGLERADGPTNAIRFGMMATLFSGLSLVALLFAPGPRRFSMLMTLGAFGGLLASFLSGSRGAIIAIPVLVLLLLPRIWRRPRKSAISFLALYVATAMSLMMLDVGSLRLRAIAALDELQFEQEAEVDVAASEGTAAVAGSEPVALAQPVSMEESVRARQQLLALSFHMFRENPIFGGGGYGWEREAVRRMQPNETGMVLPTHFNQAHNQYANDFARGGLIRGFAGLALLGVPMFLFFRSKPFSDREGSVAALAGLMTCVAFSVFSLTESVMSLSLPVSVYAVLVCYLMAAKSARQGSRRTSEGSGYVQSAAVNGVPGGATP
ncbi:O-antigen ligase family protein [Mesorhizobium sp. ZC-5]|uniref:O-antigen ligase family protein n=1 Tax=Mesorhizobium sp. ZC-5 TaxID=2986066 RepID=UPI0021E81CA2|nr:O-antigen ligase family protein [Mesorhizobium sp. ZC-5]MCV3243667.1 O-antigen ligase family protein [Mesorhizobium sp. ZC-5]